MLMKATIALFVFLAITLGTLEAQNPNNGFSLDDVRGEMEAKTQRLKAMTDAYNQVMEILSDASVSSITKETVRNRFLQHFSTDLDWTGEDEGMRAMVSNGFHFTDSRDGTRCAAIRIGNQVWMAQNLAFRPSSGTYRAYENSQANVEKYWYLYDWDTAKRVCPSGWSLPSDPEWTVLSNYLGPDAGHKVKSASGWDEENGSNVSGFNGLPSGFLGGDGRFYGLGWLGTFWSSTPKTNEVGSWGPWGREIGGKDLRRITSNHGDHFSVRCLKN